MATSLTHIAQILEDQDLDFTYTRDEAHPHIAVKFVTETYEHAGERLLTLVLDLAGDGEVVNIAAPGAFRAPACHLAAAAIAAGIIQWRTRFVQFEIDQEAGEVRPIIELPLADAPLTAAQLMRCLGALLNVVEAYGEVLAHACAAGRIDFARSGGADADAEIVEQLTAQARQFLERDLTGAIPEGKS